MREQYNIVTNGIYYAFWNKIGCWDCTEHFEPKCLLDQDDANDVTRQFNSNLTDGDPVWFVRGASLEIDYNPISAC